MGTEGETKVDDNGRGLDEAGDEQDSSRFVDGVCSEKVEGESVECYSIVYHLDIISHEEQRIYIYCLPNCWSMHNHVLNSIPQ